MEPVTHVLTGVCLARCGLNRRAAYATACMAIAAELPDIDTLWSLRGPVEGFAHHRGITHTLVGLPIEAALLVAAFYALHRWRHRAGPRPIPAAPVRWGTLYLCALLALLSHLWLDYTNSYGLRPFFPFDRRWYAGSFVFIFDPWLFALLLAALVLPALFGLIGAEIGAKRTPHRGRSTAIAAMLAICAWWGLRAWEHAAALRVAAAQTITAPPETAAAQDPTEPVPEAPPVYLLPQRVLASPDLWSPWRWTVAMDFGSLYRLAQVELAPPFAATDPAATVTPLDATYAKPPRSPAILAAERTPLGRAYLDWSPMPLLTVSPAESPTGATRVTFADARFLPAELRGRVALQGTVLLGPQGRALAETLDNRSEPDARLP